MTEGPRDCRHCGAPLAPRARNCPTCGRPTEAEKDLWSGKILFGKYRCIERIGSGATCEVYQAQHARLATLRALKLLRPELRADPRAVEAFWREAHIASQLLSPHTVRIHDADTLPDATPCTVWELIDGPSLADRVARSPLGADAAPLLRGLLGAVAELHERGWAHLDLCPQNVLLGLGERALDARLIDFGEARMAGSPAERGLEELRPGFSAPEQVLGSGSLDARADVFALGALICYAYTGHPPLASTSLASYGDWLRRLEPRKLRSLDPLPGSLRALVERCLDPDPARRPASAREIKEEIKRAARDSAAAPSHGEELATISPAAPHSPARAGGEALWVPAAEVSADVVAEGATNPMGPDGIPVRPPRAPAIPPARLEAVAGLDLKHPIALTAITALGRSASNDAVLDHPTVSKHHAQIRWDGTSYVFEDLGSRNGSSVAGKRARQPLPLKDGDRVILGEVVLRFRVEPAAGN